MPKEELGELLLAPPGIRCAELQDCLDQFGRPSRLTDPEGPVGPALQGDKPKGVVSTPPAIEGVGLMQK